jgi:hypothetical protein
MSTFWIREFKGGLDLRRLPETTPGGTLVRMFDCHINKGGEIEQRAAFSTVYQSPAGKSVGLGGAEGDALYIFGATTGDPAGMPSYMKYLRCVRSGNPAPSNMRYFTTYNNRPCVTLNYGGGDSFAFYDGTLTDQTNGPPGLAGSGTVRALLTYAQKLHVTAGSNVFFSGIRTPLLFGDSGGVGAGSGFIDFSFETEGVDRIYGMASYDNLVAFFAESTILLWQLDADPANNRLAQKLVGTGTRSPMSVMNFHGADLLYLHPSGIRSLRARDSSRYADSIDIGTPIDAEVERQFRSVGDVSIALASAVIEPLSGNLWVSLGDRIYVLSYHPLSKISAWSIYRPGFTVDAMTVFNRRVFLRSGDNIFVYGSVSNTFVYSGVVPEIWTPYFDMDRPSTIKHGRGVDIAGRGTWSIRAAMDPQNENADDDLAVVTDTTFPDRRIPFFGDFSHISLRFQLTGQPAAGPAILSAAAIHYDLDDQGD